MQLYEQVIQKCTQQRWLGTDSMLWLYRGWQHLETLPQKTGGLDTHFYYAPATDEEIRATETELGFPLPSELRSLFQHVANGGFWHHA